MMTATQALSVNPATGQTLAAMPWANAESGGERFQKVENDIGSATGANIT
ncbi:hypothetical protein P6Y90_000547 [Salmonella enterica subsp. enterica serovar Kentucky]|nr:hypothetical protein [Salmonella enterica subsp. enterica serovar Kentucky]